MKRRSFVQSIGAFWLLLAASGSAILAGCGWVADLEAIIPGLLTAISAILSQIKSAGVVLGSNVLAVMGDITTLAGDLLAALKGYTAGTTVVADVDTALSDFLGAFQNLINLLPPLPALIINLVGAGLEIILSTIQGYIQNEPVAVAGLPKSMAKFKALNGMVIKGMGNASRDLQIVPKKRNHKALAHDWNAVEPKQYQMNESFGERHL